MKKFFIGLSLSVLCAHLFAQKQTDQWYFGMNAGLDFTAGSPVPTTGALQTTEGCSTISDVQGNLLFYTNGVSVWNRNNVVMPNGTGLMGDVSTSQSALIVPQPGSSDYYYYVFTLDQLGGPNGFRYSIVDMTQDSGLGDVTTKNVLIQNNVTERMASEKQSNGIDYWVVVHDWGTNTFNTYSLSSGGLNMTPIVSNTGIVHSNAEIQYTYGQMKFSTCDDKLGVAAGYLDTVEVFSFDPATGIISNPITIPTAGHIYGLEFSPDASELYVTCYDPMGTLLQYDINGNNLYNIILSKIALSVTPDLYALQLASDGKIYVCKSWSSTLGVVNQPNIHGYGCDLNETAVNLDPNYLGVTSALGLPEFAQNLLRTDGFCIATASSPVAFRSITLSPNPAADAFTIKNVQGKISLSITTADGKTIYEFQTKGETQLTFGEAFPPGFYMVKIQCGASVTILKAVKE